MMRDHALKQPYFLLILLGLCTAYTGMVFIFNQYTTLSVDEFWFAHAVYRFKTMLPYRDFPPYKTVLGYYFLLIPMLVSYPGIKMLLFTKNIITIWNACILFLSACWMRRFFSDRAILLSLTLLVFAETTISYSSNIRVDLIAYWFCLFSFLLLLENRFLLAGLLLGLGFMSSQKVLWYILASNAALSVHWILFQSNKKLLIHIIKFNLTIVFTIALYIIFWSFLSDSKTVFHSMFYEASAMYHLDWYESARILFWSVIVLYNPLLFLLWPLTLMSIMVAAPHQNIQKKCFIITYASVILLCLIPYKQVFPYYMQVTLPVFFVLYALFFDWLFDIFKTDIDFHYMIGKYVGIVFLFAYIISFIFIFVLLQLPSVYLLFCAIPILLGLHLYYTRIHYAKPVILTLMISMGILFPLMMFENALENTSGAYQKANVNAIATLLEDKSDYVAGVELLYNHTQPIPGLRHLMGPAIDYLYAPSEKLRAVMLPSLDEDPNATSENIMKALQQSDVKFYVNNYRMMALPPVIKHYLDTHYAHYWGSIYLYAPLIQKGNTIFHLQFAGKYLVQSNTNIKLNNKIYPAKTVIELKKGVYYSLSNENYRLNLTQNNIRLDKKFQADNWRAMLL